ncbi:SMI1/KNR4 family protein [Kutzneria sp. NPDC051319]|uniref:SMI1/KNR4 family protein n=1 Tax=Kutzneria sp. NPDC051319 TaxID=3155047 RepID=UPI00343968E4
MDLAHPSTTAEWSEFLGGAGHPPAAEEDVLAAEERLGARLPPAYRNFLLASNGLSADVFAVDLLPAKEIGWLRETEPELLAAWSTPDMDFFADHAAVLAQCLLISLDDGGAGHYLFLHPGDGEWTAYEWWPGDGEDPSPHENFAAMAVELWEGER